MDDIDPVTDPAKKHKMYGRKVDVARAYDHPDVLQYRHSHGICPDQYRVRRCMQVCCTKT